MVFSSLVFLNCFLPAVLLSYFLAPKSWRNPILLAASIFFYGYGEPRYLTIMLLCVAVNYIFALAIDNSSSKRLRGLLTGTAVILNCANLLLFKYLDFILENINLVLPQGADIPVLKLVMPIGISFYTFQAVSYIIDVHSRSVKAQKNIFDLALFIMF
ncbi:MAG: MBOAT family protein, partial [Lentisphaeria bacterium]|nr:MBOAT family protein [Lentisphaeria bacterium]